VGRAARPGGGGTHLGVDVALRTLVVPDHDSAFWDDLGQRLTDEPQLRLRPRAAVRPITQPPPIIDDRLPEDLGGAGRRTRRSKRSRVGLWIVGALLTGVVVAGFLQGSGDGPGGTLTDDASTTTVAPTTAPSGTPGDPAATPAPPPPIDPAAALSPAGIGPLAVGATIRDLSGAGIVPTIDQPTFDGTGGACFDGTIQNVGDLLLRFRSPDGTAGVTDPADAVLAVVAVDSQLGSPRTTEAGIGLGAPEDQVRAAYPGELVESQHPYLPGGHILTYEDPSGTGNGIAFMTDGATVVGIVTGATDLIGFPEGCG
jgi:hypothetical protein